ncbi:MAG: DUF3995 domain-containing protein [Actinomycetota bacterium]|nr:DUF3995 domain-containing protein [Actinomycetota bacterium]
MARAAATSRPPSTNWAAYAASGWAFAFGGLSLYWGLGGTALAGTVSPDAEAMVEERIAWFIALLWAVAVLKLGIGALALALVRPWGRSVPRWMLLLAAWGAGAAMVLYGAVQLSLSVPVLTGAVSAPEAPEPSVLRWHVFLWQPYWLMGGILLLIAACTYRRHSRALSSHP